MDNRRERNQFCREQEFTLIEIVTVLAIVMIVSGIVLANLKLPVFASLDNTARSIRLLFSEAQRQTSLQGREIRVIYSREKGELYLSRITDEDAAEQNIEQQDKKIKSEDICRIPEKIEVKFPEFEDTAGDIQYRFFPDGSASGPEMELTLDERTIIMGISHLTGIAYRREAEE